MREITSPGRPLVVACLRHVDPRPAVDPVTGHLDRDPRGAGPGAAEWAALELALRIADRWDGEVLAVCAGPPDAERTLRQAAAVGARVLRVAPPGSGHGAAPAGHLEPMAAYLDDLAADGRHTARALAAAVLGVGRPDLVVCGDRSVDRGSGSVPAFLAAELGAAQALGLVRLEADGDGLSGERRLDRGWRERLHIPRPAVVSVEAAGVRLRRAGLPEVLAANRAPVPVVVAEAAPDGPRRGSARPYRPRTRLVPAPEGCLREQLLALTGALVERTPPAVVRPTSAAEAAEALLQYLRRAGVPVPPGALTAVGAGAVADPGADPDRDGADTPDRRRPADPARTAG